MSGARFILCRFIQLLQNSLHHVIRLFYSINQVKTFRSLNQCDKSELTKRILRYFLNTGCGQPATFRTYLIKCRILVTAQRIPSASTPGTFASVRIPDIFCFTTARNHSPLTLFKQWCISFPGQIHRRILSCSSGISDELPYHPCSGTLYVPGSASVCRFLPVADKAHMPKTVSGIDRYRR